MSLSKSLIETIPPCMRKIRRLTSHSLDASLSLVQLRTMAYIKEGMGQAQIADTLIVSPAAVSKMLNGLVEKKLVRREEGKDRRSTGLKLTAKGIKILGLVRGQVGSVLDKALAHLSDAEKKDLERGLNILNKLMEFVN